MRLNHKNKSYGSSDLSPADKVGRSWIILTFLCLGAFLFLVHAAWGSARISNLSLTKEKDFTQVTIYADQPFEFSHSTEEAKGGKPYRLIIDCKDVVFGLPQHGYKEKLPSGIIQAIRTNQFQVDPEKIVRVVLDLKGPVVYKVIDTGNPKTATIAILTTQDPDFPTWLAVNEAIQEKKAPTPEAEKQTASITTAETVSQTKPATEKSQAFLSNTENPPELTGSKTETFPIHKRETYRRAVSYADTGETVLPQKEEQVRLTQISSDENMAKEGANKEEVNKEKPLPLPIPPKPTLTEPTPQVSFKPGTNPVEPAPLKAEIKNIKGDEAKKDVTSTPALATSKSSSTQPEESKSPSVFSSRTSENLPETSTPKRAISRSTVPPGPYPEAKPQIAKTTGETKMGQIETGTETGTKTVTETVKKTTTTDAGSAVEKSIGAVLGTEGASAHESDTLMESGEIISPPTQEELGLIPERKIICYSPETKRDPFLPLTDKQNMSFEAVPLPRFENLKLVGIIKDRDGNQALLEDEIGFGYILKSGDQIKNGYIMSVEDNKVVFHVEEYGGYKIMTLELNPEY